MLQSGVGALHRAFEELKARLQREGLFDSQYKKTIPQFPRRIGIVTSPTGAAIQDIVNVISRRYPLVDLVLCPARVQGEGAAQEIVTAIRTFDELDHKCRPDLLIVGRGGGSIEDLWPFNEEITARAVFHCSIPVISAVGHEIDFTIMDFVADLRAPTPSAGAEEAVPDQAEIRSNMIHYQRRLVRQMKSMIQTDKLRVEGIIGSMLFRPQTFIRETQMNLDRLQDMLVAGLKEQKHYEIRRLEVMTGAIKSFNLDRFRNQINVITAEFRGHDPRVILRKGYAICSRKDGKIVSSIQDVSSGTDVDVELGDGILECKVTDRRNEV